MNAQTKQVTLVVEIELKDLGYNNSEITMFKETTVCPRCGHDFSNTQGSPRMLAHFTNCKDR
jgi:hypothetical protein